jgi:glyoxylate reductase
MGERGDRPIVFFARAIPEPGPSLLRPVFALAGCVLGDGEAGDGPGKPLSHEAIVAGTSGATVLLPTIVDRVDAEVIEAAGPSLRVISNYGVGYNNIDVSTATSRGVLVTNTPGVLTDATADLTWTLLLAAARNVVPGQRLIDAGQEWEWDPFLLRGRDLAGRTLGIVGMGRIGRAVARRAAGFGMRVVYTRRSGPLTLDQLPPDEVAGSHAGMTACDPAWEHCPQLDDLLRAADVVSLHVPLLPATHHLIGARELALMRPDAILINTSRGPVVDEAALVASLRACRPWAAALDVYEDEPRLTPGLRELPNVVLLPHLGSATFATRSRMAELAARNALAAVLGEPVPHAVNPEVLDDDRRLAPRYR